MSAWSNGSIAIRPFSIRRLMVRSDRTTRRFYEAGLPRRLVTISHKRGGVPIG